MDATDSPVVIETARLVLYLPPAAEAADVLGFVERNRSHLEPWSPVPPEGFYTVAFWEDRLERNRRMESEGTGLRTFARLRDGGGAGIVASCNVNDIVRGAFHAATLGYSMDGAHVGRGLMTEALRGLVDHAFRELRLHRVMANYMPHNRASARVLRKLGFRPEGYAQDYLRIAGTWQDHVLTSLTNADWEAPPPAA